MSRIVLVIGGSGGIGAAIASAFREAGDAVTVTGQEATEGATALDVRDTEAVAGLFAEFPRIDVLVNCAGVIRRGGAEFTVEGFADVVDINLTGTQRCCLAAHDALKETAGCIVNTASMLTYFGSAVAPAYAASKGGIGQLTRSLAMAWASDGIRVNALAPGWIETPLTRPLVEDDARSAPIVQRTPMRRWGRPEDLAGPALFLASPAAAFVTGAILPVDGGYSAA